MKSQLCRKIFRKILKVSDFMKLHAVGAELFQANRRYDARTARQMDRQNEANTRFSKFC